MEEKKLLEENAYLQVKRIQITINNEPQGEVREKEAITQFQSETISELPPIKESSSENQKEGSTPELETSSRPKFTESSRSGSKESQEEETKFEPKSAEFLISKSILNESSPITTSMPLITSPLASLSSTNLLRQGSKNPPPNLERSKQIPSFANLDKTPSSINLCSSQSIGGAGGKKKGSKVSFDTNLPELEEIEGSVVEIAMNQSGSRTLQRFVEKAGQTEIEVILMEILPNLSAIIMDDYANYMFQAICSRCTPKMRLLIIKAIAGDIVTLAKHKKGTHSLQALISSMNTENESVIFLTIIVLCLKNYKFLSRNLAERVLF